MCFKNLYIFIISGFLVSCSSSQSLEKQSSKDQWLTTWATAPQLVEPKNLPPEPGLSGNTLRQIVRVSVGGKKLRLRFSNKYSMDSLAVKAVSIAVPSDSSNVDAATIRSLTFEKKNSFKIAPGSDIYSDEVNFNLKSNSLLAITISYGKVTQSVTGHPGSRTTSFIVKGVQASAAIFKNPVKTDHWYSLSNIDVKTGEPSYAVAIMGNSITDGRGSGTNKQNRWPDIFSQRLLANPSTRNVSVLNFGIGGNCVVRGGLGPTALDRFDYNILNQQGVKWLIILEGVNDLGGTRDADDASKRIEELIAAYQVMINKAHANGIKVYGATILPFGKSFYDKPFRIEAWKKVNDWIRNSGKFDAVIDFAKQMQSENPEVILNDMHDHDFLHPNEAGYRRMGEFVDLNLFKN
ncbi:SGNH/GDSL hydrolase family protein [Chryseobacterium cucumeris]|uniref:SGNH/GDSL hydrolase family protein n=1 Tax=Chryseobacterium cucumeris TaxID=1813611 RepID=UPI003D99964C